MNVTKTTRLKQRLIHTCIACLLASLAVTPPAWSAKMGTLKIHEKPRILLLPRFYDKQMMPYHHWPKTGQLTIFHMWATWCVPCLDELPKLDKFAKNYTKDQVFFVPVALDKTLPKVEDFYRTQNITSLPVYIDPTMKIFREIEVYSLPATLFINAKGREIARIEGPANWDADDLRDFIARHLPD